MITVEALSFEVKPRRVTGFVGPNGAGKSTTMRVDTAVAAQAFHWFDHDAALTEIESTAAQPGRAVSCQCGST